MHIDELYIYEGHGMFRQLQVNLVWLDKGYLHEKWGYKGGKRQHLESLLC